MRPCYGIGEKYANLANNVRTQALTTEPVQTGWEKLGGCGLLVRIMLDEVPPTCEPLGPINKLIFAPVLLVGYMISSIDRISIGGKSPLTGGIKEANAGGRTGMHMAMMGGADHTCGLTIRAKVNHLDPLGQAKVSLPMQLNMADYDTLGACIFAGFGFATAPTSIPELI